MPSNCEAAHIAGSRGQYFQHSSARRPTTQATNPRTAPTRRRRDTRLKLCSQNAGGKTAAAENATVASPETIQATTQNPACELRWMSSLQTTLVTNPKTVNAIM